MNLKQKLIPSLILLALTGCVSDSAFVKNEDLKTKKLSEKISQKDSQLDNEAIESKRTMVKAKGAWLGGKVINISENPDLPEIFSQDWSFVFPGRLNVSTIAERLTKITGVPVRVSPDVFMSQDKFIQGGGSGSTQAVNASPVNPGPTAPVQLNQPLSSVAQSTINGATDLPVNFSGTLKDFLDLICAQQNIDWEYKNGSVELYRLVTKSFTVKAAPGNSAFFATVGKTGATQSGQAGGGTGGNSQSTFSSDGNSRMVSEYNLWPSIEASINAILSPVGKLSINQATGTIVVTDSKKIVNLVEKHIKSENAIMTRQVRLRVEFISVTLSKEHESGVDWNVVYRRLNDLTNPKYSFNIGTPAPLTTNQSGSLGFTITSNSGAGTTLDRLSGSEAVIKALSGYGQANVVTTTSAVTLNRQPVPVTLTEQIGYLASTTPAVGGVAGAGAGVPGLVPGIVTTGYILNMLPTVMDSGNVLLQFAVDVSELKRLNTVTSGQGVNQQSIQTPEVSGTQLLQRASIKAGETLVLAGFDRDSSQYDKRGLTDKYSNLTGTTVGKSTKSASVILITPVVQDGD